MNVAMRIVFVAVLVAVAPASGQQGKPGDAEIRQAVKDLGDARFAVRQRALKLLMNAGDGAEKPLREAANSGDPEVVRQARMLLDRILYHVEPDTPKTIVDLMQRFRDADTPAEQAQVVRELLRQGSRGHRFLVRLLDAAPDKSRQVILDQFAYDDWKVLSALMADAQDALVEELLDKALAAQIDSVMPHYAAFQAITGRLGPKIMEQRARAEKTGQAFDARVLLALCRLADDREGALWAVRRCDDPARVQSVLAELGRWSDLLAELPPPRPGLVQVADLGYRGAYQRLAGRNADFKQTIGQIEAYGNEPDSGRRSRPWYAAKALLVNERPNEAYALLRKHDQTEILVEVLVGQARYREALEVSEAAAQAESGNRYAARVAHIDLLLRAGLTAKARERLDRLSVDMADSTEPSWLDRLSAIQVRLGDRAAVEKRLLARLERADGSSLSATFAALYPRLDTRAEALMTMLKQQHPNVDISRLLAKLGEIDSGTMPPGELGELLKSSFPVNRHTNQPKFDVVAELVVALAQPEVAAALLAHPAWEAAPPDVRLYLADALADAGRWPAAAEAYRQVWEQDKGAALPLFLYGQALLRLNPNDAKAKDLIERSHRVPLGGESTRYYFHLALAARGYLDDSFREVSFCARLGGRSQGNALDDYANALAQRGEFAAAAAIHERNILRMLPLGAGYKWVTRYSRVTADIHLLRARAHLARGEKADAQREIDAAEALHSANLSLAIRALPALEKAGEKERAEQLFERVAGRWRTTCREYPECAHAHNQLAWLCARCRRNLDDALTHARKAVELAPLDASFKDTLAEVLFQRGDRAAAVEQIKACLKLPSSNTGFYRRQLARFQTGQPTDEPAED
jgi:tetratricopeptide (TPR) repeat protein